MTSDESQKEGSKFQSYQRQVQRAYKRVVDLYDHMTWWDWIMLDLGLLLTGRRNLGKLLSFRRSLGWELEDMPVWLRYSQHDMEVETWVIFEHPTRYILLGFDLAKP